MRTGVLHRRRRGLPFIRPEPRNCRRPVRFYPCSLSAEAAVASTLSQRDAGFWKHGLLSSLEVSSELRLKTPPQTHELQATPSRVLSDSSALT